ncbi:uncharacterized protein LOC136747491 [Amia ocellicauda]|uniref:uncharacterized protein LOC136747491 n=1 Tax=Amia ocellicauda TaxID=2972642 RepID=UPI00346385DA
MAELTAALHLCLLLSALPAQLLLSRWSGGTAAQRHRAAHRLVSAWNNLRKSYLNVSVWKEWLKQWLDTLIPIPSGQQVDGEGQSPALEVLLYSNDQGYFGASKEVRSPRPDTVLYRVGQVVVDRGNKMVGVIVSWDEKMKAPPEWIRTMYSDSELQIVQDVPHYKILFHGPGPSSVMVGYMPQTSLETITGLKPEIPTLDHYFSHFDGEQFIMKSWLKEVFPDD